MCNLHLYDFKIPSFGNIMLTLFFIYCVRYDFSLFGIRILWLVGLCLCQKLIWNSEHRKYYPKIGIKKIYVKKANQRIIFRIKHWHIFFTGNRDQFQLKILPKRLGKNAELLLVNKYDHHSDQIIIKSNGMWWYSQSPFIGRVSRHSNSHPFNFFLYSLFFYYLQFFCYR